MEDKEQPILIVENYGNEEREEKEEIVKIESKVSLKSAESEKEIKTNTDDILDKTPDLESEINYKDEHENTKKELDQMSPLYLPMQYFDLPETFSCTDAEESYVLNSKYETQILNLVDNFLRQYKFIYKDRKPLLIAPNNEYDLRKYICTFIKPTELKYPEFYNWDSAAKFISDFLDFVPLIPSTEVPSRVLSSTMVMQIRRGTCFEYCNLLCSLLLGVGYDAYVVSGYATRECCYMDQSRYPCPFIAESLINIVKSSSIELTKYVIKDPKDLKSKFELYQEARVIQQEAIDKEKRRLEEEEENKEKEKPPPDPLFGLRVHCWILIKAKSRDIDEDFFIESFTGRYVPLKTEMYTGVENIWNHENCWINMQDCSKGICDMQYDLGDGYNWEYVLPITIDSTETQTVSKSRDYSSRITDKDTEDDVDLFDDFLSLIDTPSSWIKMITLSLINYEKKYPNNEKQIIYYKTKCTRYSPYFHHSGLMMKLYLYSDMTLKELIEEREYYEKRLDKLFLVIKKDGWTIEHFTEGACYNLKEHHYRTDHPQPESERKFLFYSANNVDGLEKKEETSTSLIEHYVGRKDHLIYMACTFSSKTVTFFSEKVNRNIEKIIRRFSRNFSIACTDDVAEIILYLTEDRILITYQVDEFHLIPDTREFLKPAIVQDGKNIIPFYNDTHYHFRVDPFCKKDETKLKIYQLLLDLFANEKKCKDLVRWSECQTNDILNQRAIDKEQNNLVITLYDTIRNVVATKLRMELEATAEMERNKQHEDELDYLSPYLYNLNINDIETKEQAFKIREDCLMDFKLSLIYKANVIQGRYDSETEILQKKQQWYYQNQAELTPEQETKYLEFCAKLTFTINNLEAMLNRHKQVAPRKYIELERKIRNDDRMRKFLTAS